MRYVFLLLALLLPTLAATAQQRSGVTQPHPDATLLLGYDFANDAVAASAEGGIVLGDGPVRPGAIVTFDFSVDVFGKPPPCPTARDCPPAPDTEAYGPFGSLSVRPTLTASVTSRLSLSIDAGLGVGMTFGGETPSPDQLAVSGTESGLVLGWGATADWSLSDDIGVKLGYRGTAFNPGEVTAEDAAGTVITGSPGWVDRQVVGAGVRVNL